MNSREDILMQIWRDYYDEILEVNLDRGTFESLVDEDNANARKGFIEIEIMLASQKLVHPDDRAAFSQFFDKKKIYEEIQKGIFVRKLNFRLHRGDYKYFWVKVKGIMPSKGNDEESKYFACFRILDNASEEDMSYRKLLSVSLMHEKEISNKLKVLFEKFASELASPLNDIAGLTDIAIASADDPEKTRERLRLINDSLGHINMLTETMLSESRRQSEEIALQDDKTYVEMVAKAGKNMIVSPPVEKVKEKAPETPVKETEKVLQKIGNPAQVSVADPEDFDFTGKKIMVVPDSALSGEIMLEIMSKRGAEVVTILSGEEAVKEFIIKPAKTYDMIVLDTGIEDLDGFSIAHCIRLSCKEDAGSIPIFALSGKGAAESISKIRENGINMVFSKPVDYGMLFLKMHEVVA